MKAPAYEKRLRRDLKVSRWFPGDDTGDKAEVFPEDLSRLLADAAAMRGYIETYGVHGKFCERDGTKCVTCEVLKPKRGAK